MAGILDRLKSFFFGSSKKSRADQLKEQERKALGEDRPSKKKRKRDSAVSG